jgi:histidinol-phosphate aminotransferase
MTIERLSRRGFAGAIGAAFGAALLRPALTEALDAGETARAGPIRLNANENPYGPPESARRAIAASAADGHRYPDDLAAQVRRALGARHGVAPEQIALGCGSSQILQMADTAYLEPNRTVVAAEPTFEAVLGYADVLRSRAVKVPQTSDFRHDLPKMAAACDAMTGVVYVCNPNNPTGTIVAGDELAELASRVPRSTMILVDEAYADFVEAPAYRSALEILPRAPNVIVARTFSKIFGLAGMRLGYAVASPEVIRTLDRRASWDNVNAAVLSAALACLADSGLVARRRKELNDTRRWLCAELDRDGRRYIPSHANFVMIDVHGDVEPVIRAFRQRQILVGRKFPSMARWLRISVGTPEETRAFVDGLREIVPARKAA